MVEWIVAHEPSIRAAFFVGVLVVMAVLERMLPRRPWSAKRGMRWVSNLGIVVLNTAILRVALPATAVGIALFAEHQGWGLLNQTAAPYWLRIAIGVVILDLAIYLQHVMFHAVPLFWRLHRMHHADPDFDVTTGVRFHPIEIVLSMFIKFGVVVAVGTPAVSVLLFEVLLNATSMFSHGNIRIPRVVDRWLRYFVVTPDMHRVHHSVLVHETNSNFGFNFPWWDRLFETYRDQPQAGHDRMTIGIEGFKDEREITRLPGMLAIPFRERSGGYAINTRRT